ncbi:hypothetical protein B0I35DRAFT_473809 [Stachybotrys elegans]|uniref:CFEM domain-containing protein n=1 Tax=Stachybotrys elegans TaxID=80388 RepID=A0A8K0T2V8_9HYPO|nr:hypothetical protein B0I35DRAFT_473809 [Stachybotrys elegans]
MKWTPLLATAGCLVAGVRARDFLSILPRLPQCGSECLVSSVSASSCSNILDADCICADSTFHSAATRCILNTCNVTDAILVAGLEAQACDRPVRDRHTDLILPLVIQIPAFFCPWLRLYSRWTLVQHLAVDDYLVLAAALIYIPIVVLSQCAVFGFGVDVWTVPIPEMTRALQLFFILETLYLTCLGLTKISVLCFYLRIFPQTKFRFCALFIMGLIIVSQVIIVFMQIFQCQPVSYTWEGWTKEDRDARCLNLNALTYSAAGASIAQDVIILLLPLPLLFKLQTGLKNKIGITIMFSLGIFILLTSCIRLRFLVSFGHTTNPSWDYTDPAIWSGVEIAVSLIVVCLPAIRSLVNHLVPGWVASVLSRTGGTRDGSTGASLPGITKGSRLARLSHRPKDGTILQTISHEVTYSSHGTNESQIELGRTSDVHHNDHFPG